MVLPFTGNAEPPGSSDERGIANNAYRYGGMAAAVTVSPCRGLPARSGNDHRCGHNGPEACPFASGQHKEGPMSRYFSLIALMYGAGSIGALVNSLAAWAIGVWGVTASAGVKMAPDLTPAWLYPRLVWGGLWGFLFLLPVAGRYPLAVRALLFSLAPTLMQLLYVFPYRLAKGFFGLDLGGMTPLFVLLLNAIWGLAAAFWIAAARERTA
jgi:hypothetical protein